MKNNQTYKFEQLRTQVTGVILAGGQGTRMGGADKGWVEFRGKPLVEHVIERLRAQTDHILIVANRNTERYAQLSAQVVADDISGFQGPLAGIHAALKSISTPWALIVPTDAPLFPLDLLQQLGEQVLGTISAAKFSSGTSHPDHPFLVHDGEREQPLFGLYPRSLVASLERSLLAGERRLMRWCQEQRAEWIDFSTQRDAFANMNSPTEIQRYSKSPLV